MGKYDPLCERLARTHGSIELPFAEIGDLVGGLPPSAYRHSAWWSNNPTGHERRQRETGAGAGVMLEGVA